MDERILELARTTPFSYAALRGAWEMYADHYARVTRSPTGRIADTEKQRVWDHFVNLIHASGSFGDATPLYGAMAIERLYGIKTDIE